MSVGKVEENPGGHSRLGYCVVEVTGKDCAATVRVGAHVAG